MIERVHAKNLKLQFFRGKAIILLGARQTGKTKLVRHLINETGEHTIYFNCDEPAAKTVFENISSERWKQLIGNNKIIVIDEAQLISNRRNPHYHQRKF
jgi:uncharacterized protein